MPEYNWPPLGKRKVIGQRLTRLDGTAKSSGRAKYPSDLRPQGVLFAAMLTCPHAHARVKAVDTSAAEKMKGVRGVRVISPAGTEIQWAGTEVAAVAADTEPQAHDALRAIKVDYEVLPHVVQEENVEAVGARAKAAGEEVSGDPDKAFADPGVVVSEGSYGLPVITHCCLEPHGQVIEWKGEKLNYWPSTQGVSVVGGDLAKSLEIPAANVNVQMEYMGGGFGSKFPSDRWGTECAHLSKMSGGRPVHLFLDRETELTIAGIRPSHFAKIRVAATKDGAITGWQSESWSTGGFTGGGRPPIPYVFTKIPNYRINHKSVSTNTGPGRAWRAPNHPQASYLTCAALEDCAAKLNMDPVEFFSKNADLTPRPATYRRQLAKAAELIEWKKLWRPRGEGSGVVRRGLGIGVNTWGGAGHGSRARTVINPDGSVEILIGSQDLGTGTRTIIAMIAAETLGLPLGQINVKLGSNAYPPSGPSGGSTTVGGVSSATRKSTVNALTKLLEAVAPSLGVPATQLEAIDGRIRVIGNPDKGMSFQQAAAKLGVTPIDEAGENNPQNPGGLNTGGASGVQMADVSVDMETGRVKINRMVAVQDCGLIVNPRTAESQVYGAMIMSACSALCEERVMDAQTGRVLNPDMEFYKLAGIADIGDFHVHMEIDEENDKRGIIGLGEPPAIGGVAAIANAVANAAGVRVPNVPLTPYRVLTALAAAGRV